MSQQWRSHHQPQLCPYCSYPHFPFCPPPQNPNYHTPPPHPIPPPLYYSEHSPQGIPPPPLPQPPIPPQSLKRTRLHEFENERRLKLVRDHGLGVGPPCRYETEINGDVYDRVLGNRGYLPRQFFPPLPNSPPPPIVEPPPLPPPIRSPRPLVFPVGDGGSGMQHRLPHLRSEPSRLEESHQQRNSFLRNELSRVSGSFSIEEAQQHREPYLRREPSRVLAAFNIEEAQQQPYLQRELSRFPVDFNIEENQQHQEPYLHSASNRIPAGFSIEEAQQYRQPYLRSEPSRFSSGFSIEEAEQQQQQQSFMRSQPSCFSTGFSVQGVNTVPSKQFGVDGQSFQLKKVPLEKAKVVDASELFKIPHRVTRPDHFVIILRGLPGSGKSYLAKMLRDMEVENGGDAPRIHSMDEYFMTEVEKEVDENESSSMTRGKKKPVLKKFMEYCYEPEMEEAYRASMLKAFKKTLDDGAYTFVIVDDRNLRVADFAQFWAIAKRSGYEVYILEAPYKDPAGCAARNVHRFTQDDIQEMAGQWEEAPPLYLQLDIKSLLRGDLKESDIQEVDMDTEGDFDEAVPGMQEKETENIVAPDSGHNASDESQKDKKRWDAEGEHPTEVKGLGLSKWSEDLDDDGDAVDVKGKTNSLSGLIQVYSKRNKSVHWGDQGTTTGFSIAATKKSNVSSLLIGPGAGYNLKSNPLPEEDNTTGQYKAESKGRSSFQERLRAERESFKAVFDRRRQRIGGLGINNE